jgi:DNA-binding response OmpR family regulator
MTSTPVLHLLVAGLVVLAALRITSNSRRKDIDRPPWTPASTKCAVKRVVVVSDDELMRELFRHLLLLEGYSAIVCPSGTDAGACVREAAPDAIILGVQDRSLAGVILDRLRVDAAFRETPVVVCTVDESDMVDESEREQHVAELQNRGCAVLAVPFDVDELCTLLRQVMNVSERPAQQPVAVERRSGLDRRGSIAVERRRGQSWPRSGPHDGG